MLNGELFRKQLTLPLLLIKWGNGIGANFFWSFMNSNLVVEMETITALHTLVGSKKQELTLRLISGLMLEATTVSPEELSIDEEGMLHWGYEVPQDSPEKTCLEKMVNIGMLRELSEDYDELDRRTLEHCFFGLLAPVRKQNLQITIVENRNFPGTWRKFALKITLPLEEYWKGYHCPANMPTPFAAALHKLLQTRVENLTLEAGNLNQQRQNLVFKHQCLTRELGLQ